MEGVNEKSSHLPSRIRRIARICTILYFAILIGIIILEILNPHGGAGWRPRDLVLAAFIPIGAFSGMVLAWRWEGLGGVLTTLSVVAFYLAMCFLDGSLPRVGVFGMLIPLLIPGVLFLISWRLHRRSSFQSCQPFRA